ncbi:hypothetical protein ACIGO6_37775 [Streptomyces sp. NPDC053750]|uniref:hypothetical protein n=1 Tax=Streptomyces sp. NPDC053750 TaxID=3365714 RepID=UPI0037CFE8D1
MAEELTRRRLQTLLEQADRIRGEGLPQLPLQTDRVLFEGVDVFALPAREVVRRISAFTSLEEDPDDAASFVAQDLLLSFWRPSAADDEPQEEQGYYFTPSWWRSLATGLASSMASSVSRAQWMLIISLLGRKMCRPG